MPRPLVVHVCGATIAFEVRGEGDSRAAIMKVAGNVGEVRTSTAVSLPAREMGELLELLGQKLQKLQQTDRWAR